VVHLAAKFLVCGTLRGDLPYEKVRVVRERNRKIGLGLMGLHEWLLQRGYGYEVVPELHEWLRVYAEESEAAANEHCDRFYINRPRKYRAVAPAGTIGILASTTTGIEPIYTVAYKRRFLDGNRWKYQFVIDPTAERIIKEHGLSPDSIETAMSLAATPEKRIAFQADIQQYVDMGISSTINLPEWGTEENNEDTAKQLAYTLANYCERLRGITVYPNGARGGQPLVAVPYDEAVKKQNAVYEESAENVCKGGVCGI